MAEAGYSQSALGAMLHDRLGIRGGQSKVSQWRSGTHEPGREVVAGLEQVLSLPPGRLSQHLGYRPAPSTDSTATPDVRTAIDADRRLTAEQKRALRVVYNALANSDGE
jgi:hypothetical protein